MKLDQGMFISNKEIFVIGRTSNISSENNISLGISSPTSSNSKEGHDSSSKNSVPFMIDEAHGEEHSLTKQLTIEEKE
jgi:hypothetical protein